MEDGSGEVPTPSGTDLHEAGGMMRELNYYTGVVTAVVAASVIAIYYGSTAMMWMLYWMANLI